MGVKPSIVFLFLGTFLIFLLPKQCLSTTSQEEVNHYLTAHNNVRAKLGLPPLQWSEQLASYARWWASKRQGDCAMIHSGSNYGENLFWGGTGKEWGAEDAVAFWADEKKFYNYFTNTCGQGQECLHYTQIIWKDTQKVGCAKAKCVNGYTFITCNYDPHGNILGEKPYF